METNYFEASPGNKSSSRLIGFTVIISALIYVGFILYLGRTDIVQAATAAGVLFVTIAGPAMAFLFAQKKTEINQQNETR